MTENDSKEDGTDVWGISDFKSEKSNKDRVPDKFKDKCIDSLRSKEISNNSLLDQVKKWCVKPKGQE